jgi:hypothetical protein
MTRQCWGCPATFNGVPQQRYCEACKLKNKRAADMRSHQRCKAEVFYMTDEEEAAVDARFTEALAEIRRSGVHRVEAASWNYSSRYREP